MAESFDVDKGFKALFETHQAMPKMVELISYEMFLNSFDHRSCSEPLYQAYKIILEFAKELQAIGFVKYKD
jgi:hypothetical protein